MIGCDVSHGSINYLPSDDALGFSAVAGGGDSLGGAGVSVGEVLPGFFA
jgi:hypothetical protein